MKPSIMLQESQTSETRSIWFHLCEIHKGVKFIETENRILLACIGWLLNEYRVSVWEDEECSGAVQWWQELITLNYKLKNGEMGKFSNAY